MAFNNSTRPQAFAAEVFRNPLNFAIDPRTERLAVEFLVVLGRLETWPGLVAIPVVEDELNFQIEYLSSRHVQTPEAEEPRILAYK